MIRLLIFLFLLTPLYPHSSSREDLASLHGEPSALIFGCVNAITGDLVFFQEDAIIKGHEPIPFLRHYTSRDIETPALKWNIIPHSTAIVEVDASIRVIIPEKRGVAFLYLPEKKDITVTKKGFVISPPLKLVPARDQFRKGLIREPSSDHPSTNQVLLDENTLKVIHLDGSYRFYQYWKKKTSPLDGLGVFCLTKTQMLLDHERLANGNFIYYKWKNRKGIAHIESIETRSPLGQTLAKAIVKLKKHGKVHVTTSDNHRLKYQYAHLGKTSCLIEVNPSKFPREICSYNGQLRLQKRIFPDGRTLEIKYDKQGRVKSLSGPGGALCKLEYHEGKTCVIDPQGNETDYVFNPSTLRLEKIEVRKNDGKCLKKERYFWDSMGNLVSKEIEDDLSIEYIYNAKGKLEKKTLKGPITEEGRQESYSYEYCYNDASQLIQEKEDNGKKINYQYLEGTNLLQSKILSKNENILTRTFYEYDQNHLLIREVLDDGPNGTYCEEKKISPCLKEPFFGFPISIEEFMNGHYIQKITYAYDNRGNICRKALHDAEGYLQKEERFVYNKQDQLIKQIDAEGNITNYQYDENGNLIKEHSSTNLIVERTYDKLNRCIQKKENEYETRYCHFDLNGNPTLTIDPLKGETHFTYDPLGNLIEETNSLGMITKYAYTPLGKRTHITDPLGNTTITSYNIYGEPLRIIYPDGTEERYTYNLDGSKSSYTDQNNVTTYFAYDDYGHLIQEDGPITIEKMYDTFHLLEETDPEGVKTTYTYQEDGKLASKRCGELITTYRYDSLGRCTEEKSLDYRISKTYDKLDRVISIKEYSDDILLTQKEYSYDPLSNILTETCYPGGESATTRYKYDPFGRLIEEENPLGQITKISYHPQEKILQKMIEEPGDLTLIETYNTQNQKIQIEKKHQNATIAKADFFYTPTGQLETYTATIYQEKTPISTYSVLTTYDEIGRKKSVCENGLKTTYYSYTPTGQVETLTKPNGIILSYEYDIRGHLVALTSSDGEIEYHYNRNARGELLSSYDSISQKNTERRLDSQGRILEETLANGLQIKQSYDALGRRIALILPNQTTINYTYLGPYLKSILFGSYIHTYHYDLAGNIIKEEAFNHIIEKDYDLNQQLKSLHSPYFTQTLNYDARGNITDDLYRHVPRKFAYDPLDHLIKEPFHTYTYDSFHNRRSKDEQFYLINPLNQLETWKYDDNGNPIQLGKLHLKYDPLDRLIKVTTPEATHTYSYDTEHRRITKDQEAYIWDGECELGTQYEYRILGVTHHGEIGAAVALIKNTTPLLPIHDMQGNLIQIDQLDGGPVEKRTFTVFGESFSSLDIPWGYCSKRHDPETNFVYFGKRYYDPDTGRFLTPDPSGYTDSYNVYAYCFNNPLVHQDAHGLLSVPIITGQYTLFEDEGDYQRRLGMVHGAGRWVTQSALNANLLLGGVHGLEDMSLLESYTAHLEGNHRVQAASERWLTTSIRAMGGDSTNASYQSGIGKGYIGADFLAWAFLPSPLKAAKPISKGIKVLRAESRTARASQRLFQRIFQEKQNVRAVAIKGGRRKRLKPDLNAIGEHTTFRRDPVTGRVTHYATFRPQTNIRNPKNRWELIRRFDYSEKSFRCLEPSNPHYNKKLKRAIYEPHVHEPIFPGGIRPALPWEIPN